MKKDVLIKITGTQLMDEESGEVQITTTGSYLRRGGAWYISYNEARDEEGLRPCRTTVKVEQENRVTMTRAGRAGAQLIIESGRRHQCLYDFDFAMMTVGVSGGAIHSELDDEGGRLEFSYSLDINTAVTSENRVVIEVSGINS